MQSKGVFYWLITGCVLIAAMVIIGGITRLTHSGLSMVDWKPIMGTLPPMNQSEWTETFDMYKQSPEFKLVNYNFDLEDFKSIFWWEYIHRLIGRLIGIIFIVPFIFFIIKGHIRGNLLTKCFIILFLGGFQGVLGWYMVKSGLSKDPQVSHYRLAAHLMNAFLAFGYTLWVALEVYYKDKLKLVFDKSLHKWNVVILILTTLQIIYGAFVAGLRAGSLYNTWPKMGDEWVAESVTFALQKNGLMSLIDNPASVQFVHRCTAILLFSLVIWMYLKFRKTVLNKLNSTVSVAMVVMVFVQFLLGVLTLVYGVPVSLGVIHQFGALMLFTLVIWNMYAARGNS